MVEIVNDPQLQKIIEVVIVLMLFSVMILFYFTLFGTIGWKFRLLTKNLTPGIAYANQNLAWWKRMVVGIVALVPIILCILFTGIKIWTKKN